MFFPFFRIFTMMGKALVPIFMQELQDAHLTMDIKFLMKKAQWRFYKDTQAGDYRMAEYFSSKFNTII